MNYTYSVIIPIFGDIGKWKVLAQQAFESVQNQTVQPQSCYISQADNLGEARNQHIFDGTVTEDRIIFLDADDCLHPEFIEHVDKVEADIVHTAVSYDGGPPVLLRPRDLRWDNFLVCGSPVNRELFIEAGGFDEELEGLEDWDLFARMCIVHGATIGRAPEAIYQITSLEYSRNRKPETRKLVPVLREKFKGL